MNEKADVFDVVILGGGTVGITLALSLVRNTPLSVAIVEPNVLSEAQDHPGFDSRCLALGQNSFDYLADVIDSATFTHRDIEACPITHIQVSDQGYLGKCHLSAEEQHSAQVGVVAPLHAIGNRLYTALKSAQESSSKLSLFCPATAESVERNNDFATVALSTGERLQCRLLVLADGGRSSLKSTLGFDDHTQDYEQDAIIANVEFEQPHQQWAYERFTQSGPLALLPLTLSGQEPQKAQRQFSLVWTVNRDDKQNNQRLLKDDKWFKQHLTAQVSAQLGRCVEVSERFVYPLSLRYAQNTHQHRCVVVGNAAQMLHPIAGQGFNLGIRDIQDLVITLSETDEANLGDWSCLSAYSKRRERDRKQVITTTDLLVHSFSNHHWPMVAGRNIGLMMMDATSGVKQQFARRAMGFRHG